MPFPAFPITAVLKIAGAALLLIVILLGLAITIVPRFLDRIYYRGPASDHFTGERFFNPGQDDDTFAPPTGGSRAGFFWRYLTGRDGRPAWPAAVAVAPSTPPARVEGERMLVTWIGHATVLVQTHGLNILTDPVWSDRTGPWGRGPKRVAAPGVRFEDLPRIDLLLVSHNHYDHLDKPTLERLWARDKPLIVTSLGNDSVIGQTGAKATAVDWRGRVVVRPGVDVVVVRAHHWGSRWFTDRNRALWSGFVVRLPSGGNLHFAGDTGFGDGEWPREAAAYGPIRLSILPIGAFRFAPGQMRIASHMGPAEAMAAFDRTGAGMALPVHWGTFRLSFEGYDTPPKMLEALMRCTGNDPARFAAHGIGQPFEAPPVSAPRPPLDLSRLDACAGSDAVRALP